MEVFKTPQDYYRFFANESRRGGSPLYERLSLAIAEDGFLQSLADGRRRGQPAANLIFAAVHYLLLGGTDDPLKEYYPNLGGARPADDRAASLFAAFAKQHEARLREIIAVRVTNTNEVGRSALLMPAFEVVFREAGAPLALIEIGSSAGLNLNCDRYGYRYANEKGVVRLERRLNSRLVIPCTLKGDGVPVLSNFAPPIASRLGLELEPIDITKESERQWLRALVWPERLDRFRKLEGALVIAQDHMPPIRGGDAILNLEGALQEIPRDHAAVVYHTVMAYQLNRDQTQRIDAILLERSKTAPIWRVTVEGEVSGPNPKETINPLRISRYMGGERQWKNLGLCDPHGLWIEWKG